LRLLSYPAYTGSDEKVLNRAGDMAALAVIRRVSMEDFNSPEKATQILLTLHLAFAAPQLVASSTNRRPTAAMLLLDHLSKTKYDREHVNEIENTRSEIQHSTPVRGIHTKSSRWRANLRWMWSTRSGCPVYFAGRLTLNRE
jgi:hypothetical protein